MLCWVRGFARYGGFCQLEVFLLFTGTRPLLLCICLVRLGKARTTTGVSQTELGREVVITDPR